MIRIFRSEAALFDDSIRTQILEFFLGGLAEGSERTPTFEDLLEICEDATTQDELLGAVVGLLDDRLLVELDDRRLLLVRPSEARIQIGFFTEDTLDLVPEGVNVVCLTDGALETLDEGGAAALAAELAEEVARDLN